MKGTYSTARELRAQARNRLKNRWFVAIVAFLIVSLLGAGGISLKYNFGSSSISMEDELAYDEITQDIDDGDLTEDDFGEYDLLYRYQYDADHGGYITDTLYAVLVVAVITVIAVLVVGLLSLYSILVGAPLTTGYCYFNLKLFKTRKEVSLNLLLNGFKKGFSHSAGVAFFTGLIMLGTVLLSFLPAIVLIAVGSLLMSDAVWFLALLAFLIGIYVCGIKLLMIELRYSMCHYILADHPDMPASDVLKESKRLMEGHKWRLFCLRLSFIGWIFLSLFTCGIGLLWVGPYMHATETAFYRELEKGGKRYNLLRNLFH